MKKDQQKALLETIKEALRLALCTFASVFIAALLEAIPGLELDPLYVLLFTGLLRMADKAVFEYSKRVKGTNQGLLP